MIRSSGTPISPSPFEVDYPILSDPGKKVARAYGVVTDKRAVPFRWTFYIGKEARS
ncbi:MAG: hypothetical protein Ct9H300mP1_27590 [Planctomycetaceae bacterium]|nr:MAG: hypothetical protein Ct9H300mP1_27590 [Planctomycetaceae bacterium]